MTSVGLLRSITLPGFGRKGREELELILSTSPCGLHIMENELLAGIHTQIYLIFSYTQKPRIKVLSSTATITLKKRINHYWINVSASRKIRNKKESMSMWPTLTCPDLDYHDILKPTLNLASLLVLLLWYLKFSSDNIARQFWLFLQLD